MSIASATSLRVAPSEVHETLKRHMLADGCGVVLDFERSHGPWLYDSLRERESLMELLRRQSATSATTLMIQTPAITAIICEV